MNNYCILYAEDEEQTRLNYTNYLQRYFKEVYSVTNGQEALDYYNKYKPQILLLDINMPKINGLELAEIIRVKDKITRIIILTANLQQDKLLLAAELNLTKYLPKPISREALKSALNLAVLQIKELENKDELIYLGDDCTWDKTNKKLLQNKVEVKLTKYEILLLELLSSQKYRIFSSDEIGDYLWDDINDTALNTSKLKDIMKRLRKKIPKDSISNVYGVGFKLIV